MKTAFKEWAVICHALGTGRQVLILRKGGIGEDAGMFRPEHREFLFFPTGFHQSPGKVLPEADRLLREAEAERPSADQVTFRHFAVLSVRTIWTFLYEVPARSQTNPRIEGHQARQ